MSPIALGRPGPWEPRELQDATRGTAALGAFRAWCRRVPAALGSEDKCSRGCNVLCTCILLAQRTGFLGLLAALLPGGNSECFTAEGMRIWCQEQADRQPGVSGGPCAPGGQEGSKHCAWWLHLPTRRWGAARAVPRTSLVGASSPRQAQTLSPPTRTWLSAAGFYLARSQGNSQRGRVCILLHTSRLAPRANTHVHPADLGLFCGLWRGVGL